MPCSAISLGQHWLRQWLVAWWHKAITWTNVDSSKIFPVIHLIAISQEVLMNLICNKCSEITLSKRDPSYDNTCILYSTAMTREKHRLDFELTKDTLRGARCVVSIMIIFHQTSVILTTLWPHSTMIYRYYFMYASSQWETTLHCNVVSHWLNACKKWFLDLYPTLYCLWLAPWPR